MTDRLDGARILIYSHDSFGLGHLRRCRAIAHAMVECYKGLSVLILSGSPIIGSFDFRARVDFVRVPGVIKLHNGEYTSLGLHIDLEETLAMRASIIQHTARSYAPDLFLVDKEPLGLKGEIRETLALLKDQGVTTVLGLRDVMDAPEVLAEEWQRKSVARALEQLYDELWVYGIREAWDPLHGLALSQGVHEKVVYTGYLERGVPRVPRGLVQVPFERPFLLVTAGGGGDGGVLFDWVLRAYEEDCDLPLPALFVFGPFMAPAQQRQFQRRIDSLPNAEHITFDSHFEVLMDKAAAVVAMGGYNTFCEILSLNKPALLVPRWRPRQEQMIRVQRARDLGLVSMLDASGRCPTGPMCDALRALPAQPGPLAAAPAGLLAGLETVCQRVGERVRGNRRQRVAFTAAG